MAYGPRDFPFSLICGAANEKASSRNHSVADLYGCSSRLCAGDLYRVPEIVTRGRFPDGGESDSTWRTQEARHVGSDTIAPGF